MSEALGRRCRFGLFDFDAATGELRREGDVVKLAPQPARVLALLLSRPGAVVLRDELRRELWGDDTFVDFERSLNFCIQQVRGALGDASDNPRFVQTVPRRGYRFIAPVSSILPPAARPTDPVSASSIPAGAETGSDSAGAPVAEPAAAAPRAVGAVWREWALAGAAGAAMVALATWLLWSARPQTTGAPATGATAAPRVVVLPFANLTGDPDAAFLVDGLTDEVITQLGALGRDRLAVIARTSAMSYRDTQKTIAAIGAELDARYVVEGALRRDQGGLRVTASLVPAASQTPLARWEETFDTRSTSPDAPQTYAAIRLARLVALKLLDPGEAPRTMRTTNDAAAWEKFLEASSAVQRGTASDVRRAVSLLEEAVAADATFAAAWAQLAQVRHTLVMMGAERPATAYAAARTEAARAIDLDPGLAGAHLAQGLVDLWYAWNPAEAARAFERALALNASDATAHHDLAWALVALGRPDEAVRQMAIARTLDPLSTRANNDVGWLHLHLRQPTEAARACQHTLAIDAGSLEAQACLERAHAQRQRFDAALEAARMATPPDAGFARASNESAAEMLHRLWRWRADRMARVSQTRWVSPYMMAGQYALIGETRSALAALESAYAERVGMMVLLPIDPVLDGLRGEPRFQSLLEKVTARSR